jgi:hypothetical protein
VAVCAFWLYASGPAFALLRAELHLSRTMAGVYAAVWPAGAVLAEDPHTGISSLQGIKAAFRAA